MTLPRVLAPWAEQLDAIRPETSTLLAPWMPRLAAFVGPLRSRIQRDQGPLDGYEGIEGRGPYDRLLLSEWLLATELPDEFTRRATMGEHLFLAPARREPAGAKRSVILFDAGPTQLGQPRLVHMALLVLFARRAAEADLILEWGSLDHIQLREAELPSDLKRLAHSRTLKGPGPTDDWQARLEGIDDGWLVGGPERAELAASLGLRLLVVEQTLNHLSVTSPTAHRPPLRLEIDDAVAASGVLTDPLQAALITTSGPSVSGLDRRLFHANHTGNYLLVNYNGVKAIWTGRKRPNRRAKYLHVPQDHTLVAVTMVRRHIHALTLHTGQLQLIHGSKNRVSVPLYADAPGALLPSPHTGPTRMFLTQDKGRPRVTLQNAAGYVWVSDVNTSTLERVGEAAALGWGPSGPRWVDAKSRQVVDLDEHGTPRELFTRLSIDAFERLLLGRGGWISQDGTKCIATTPCSSIAVLRQGTWTLQRIGAQSRPVFELPDPGGVFAVTLLPMIDVEPCLVAWQGDRIHIKHRAGDRTLTMQRMPLAVELVQDGAEVAALMPDATIHFYDLLGRVPTRLHRIRS